MHDMRGRVCVFRVAITLGSLAWIFSGGSDVRGRGGRGEVVLTGLWFCGDDGGGNGDQ